MITTVAIRGFRSLRDIVLPLGRTTVIQGRNGVGKSSVYRALSLLAATAQGTVNRTLAEVGGFESVLWAGPEIVSGAMRRGEVLVQGTGKRKAPVTLALGFTSDDLGYLVDIGLPVPSSAWYTAFSHDPEIKREIIWAGGAMRPANQLVRRRNAIVEVRTDRWTQVTGDMERRESLISEVSDPDRTPEVLAVRRMVRAWRFYDSFRTDTGAPARHSAHAVYTPVLADDGSDLAAAVETVLESAMADSLQEVMRRAVSGELAVRELPEGRLGLTLRQDGMLRPLSIAELSDGTVRLICLAAALLSPRPPELMVVNEPETSLHPEVLPALVDLMRHAAERTQLVVVSHSTALAEGLARDNDDAVVHHLVKPLGETLVDGQGLLSRPQWEWGKR